MKEETNHSENAFALSGSEKSCLASLEKTISKGWDTFLAVGRALSTIREERLYRDDYPTFKATCLDKWQMGRSYASRLIGTVEIIEELSENLDDDIPLPQNEAQVRCLKGLNTEQRVEIWGRLMEERDESPLTAKKIRDHLKEYLGQDDVNQHNGNGTLKTPKRIIRLMEMFARELEMINHGNVIVLSSA